MTALPDGWTESSLAAAERNATRLFDYLAKITMLERAQCSPGIGFVKRMKLTSEYVDVLTQAEILLEKIANA